MIDEMEKHRAALCARELQWRYVSDVTASALPDSCRCGSHF